MHLLELLDYLEPPVSIGFDVLPEQALEHFHAKGLSKSVNYTDLSAAEHANSFTVAKMMDMDMLGDVKTSLEKALAKGTPFKQWANEIMPDLQAKGWLANEKNPPWRLETIFRTNMQSAYAVGEWQQIKAQEEIAPYLMYDAVDDFRTRPEHAALDGQIHLVGSEFWVHYHPPNDYNCRCGVIQLSLEEVEELGLAVSPPFKIEYYTWTNPKTGRVEKVAKGTGPGFDFNPGEMRFQQLQKIAQQKAAAMSADAAKAANEGLMKAQAAAAATARVEAQAVLKASQLSNASKAAERLASFHINKALDEKTPYLSKAIQVVKATAAGKNMSSTELLNVAKEKAAKLEASTQLSEYKKSVTGGKKPNAKAQSAFDALPEEAQQALTEQIQAAAAKVAAENAALKGIQELIANPNSLGGKIHAKMLADGSLTGKTAPEVFELLKGGVAAAKAKQVNAQGIAGLKKAVLTGKTPTPAQKAAFQSLTEAEQTELMVDLAKQKAKALVDAEVAKPSAPPPPQAAIPDQPNVTPGELDPEDLVQTGPQGGSNPGGEYTDTTTGTKWYLKYPDNVEALRNEALAANLYRLAGVDMPEVRLITFKGRPAIASRIVEGLKVDRAALSAGRVPGVQENFAIDAWLSNWDAVGPDFANTKLNALGRGVRIDPGGALRYRAQGGLKGEAFGNDVLELESMRDGSTNPHASAVFRHVTKADLEDGVRRILAISDKQLVKLLADFGPTDIAERQKLFRTLVARREYLAKKYPGARPQAAEKIPGLRVTETEQRAIEASRANGVTLPTDSDVIEDHQVVVTTLKGVDGKPRTRVTFKLRPESGNKLQADMKTSAPVAQPVLADFDEVKGKALEFFRGVGALAKKGEAIRAKDLERAGELLIRMDKITTALNNTAKTSATPGAGDKALYDLARLRGVVQKWAADAAPGKPAKAFDTFDLDTFPSKLLGRLPDVKAEGLTWQAKDEMKYAVAQIERGAIKETSQTSAVPGVEKMNEVELDGARVRYVPYGKGNSVTSEGYMQLDLDGAGADVTAKAFGVMNKLGIPTTRPSEIDRLELYLERIASIRTLRNKPLAATLSKLRQITDQAQRTDAMLKALNDDVGFDMRTSPSWNPQGVTQAFGHGRTLQIRPDIDAGELAAFEKDVVIYHNPNGYSVGGNDVWSATQKLLESGGQLASQMDRVRRGVMSRGSSVGQDHAVGGANYIFSRLMPRSRLKAKTAGIYWKARQATRLDAFSYDSDVFGNVSRSVQERSRARTLIELRSHSNSTANETNFRDSISLFDDLEKIVLNNRADYDAAMRWLKEHGYTAWPDGRSLTDVFDYKGSGK